MESVCCGITGSNGLEGTSAVVVWHLVREGVSEIGWLGALQSLFVELEEGLFHEHAQQVQKKIFVAWNFAEAEDVFIPDKVDIFLLLFPEI